MAIEIVDLPIQHGGYFHSFLWLLYQRVIHHPKTFDILGDGHPGADLA